MDTTLLYILGALILVSLVALSGILLVSFKRSMLDKLIPWLVAFAAGSLLAASLFDLLPESLELLGEQVGPLWVAGGILVFMLLENILHIHHAHHDGEDDHHYNTTGYAILFGDGLHNFIDGVLIASAFMVSIPLGISVTLAVILHEIPQEVGDFAILLHSGFTKARALWFNFISALTAVVGGLVAYFALQTAQGLVPYLLAIGAGGFLYIALVDIVGSFKHSHDMQNNPLRMFGVVLGLVVIGLIIYLTPHEG